MDAKCDAKVCLKETRYHDVCEGVYTSHVYTVVNTGDNKVKIVAAEGDSVDGCDHYLELRAGKSVTLQNYKKTWYVVA